MIRQDFSLYKHLPIDKCHENFAHIEKTHGLPDEFWIYFC